MSKPDGGPAFPLQEQMQPAIYGGDTWLSPGQSGMSLRDWFAGQALTFIKSSGTVEQLAEQAYLISDAMIAERQQ